MRARVCSWDGCAVMNSTTKIADGNETSAAMRATSAQRGKNEKQSRGFTSAKSATDWAGKTNPKNGFGSVRPGHACLLVQPASSGLKKRTGWDGSERVEK